VTVFDGERERERERKKDERERYLTKFSTANFAIASKESKDTFEIFESDDSVPPFPN
jgi:hypothetical protein